MTRGEIDLASMIFQDAIDYRKVRIHNRPYLWCGLQPKNVAMAPNGQMYFHYTTYSEDFSCEGPGAGRWFIHEMTHIWQHQLGYPVTWRGAIRIGLGYRYRLDPDRRLSEYNMEAQGEILSDYFALKYLGNPRVTSQATYGLDDIELYEKVLRDFFSDRKHAGNLPGRGG
jgi:type VI secretion system secreted protein VgrG